MSKIIAVWGSPGSGKTTTACKLAYELASKTGKDTALLTNDIIAPSLPVLFPILKKKDMENKSVGRILQNTDITQNNILLNSVVVNNNLPLIAVGYALGENINTFEKISVQKASELILQLSQMAEFVIIDCTSDVTNVLTKVSLMQADSVIQLYKPEHRSEVFFVSQESLIMSEKISSESFVKVMRLGLSKKYQPENEINTIAKNIKYVIPFSIHLCHQYDSGAMFENLPDIKYSRVIKTIVEDVIINADKN